jgi:hypothetical protein
MTGMLRHRRYTRFKTEMLKNGITRASALGGQDKEFSFIIREPDCGKGVFTKLISTTLDEYFDNFNSGNLIANKGVVSAEDEKNGLGLLHCGIEELSSLMNFKWIQQ